MKVIVTLGPSTNTEQALRKIKDKGVSFVRINMSHSSLDDLTYFIHLSKKVGIPFVLDTEGSQIRTGALKGAPLYFEEGSMVELLAQEIQGTKEKISIRPASIIPQLEEGDIIYCDFDSLVLRVEDTSMAHKGYIIAQAIVSGFLGSNKGVVVDGARKIQYDLPPLSPKDLHAVKIGLKEKVGFIAASFMRSKEFVNSVRCATKNRMKIISKLECVDGLEHLDDIIDVSDFLLIDRGDLSKEVPIERIPLLQKAIIERARKKDKGVYVATNLLETMVERRKPTRAEVHDIEQTVLDGAHGLTLAAETAIGTYPLECINTLKRIVHHVEESFTEREKVSHTIGDILLKNNYVHEQNVNDSLAKPHGGALYDGLIETPDRKILKKLPRIHVSDENFMDAEQIALGTFSPISGFLGKRDATSILNTLRLRDGVPWPLPIVLDVSKEDGEMLPSRGEIILEDKNREPFGILYLKEKYTIPKDEFAWKLYGTRSEAHPGVKAVFAMNPVFLSGEVRVFRRRHSPFKCYELTPRQTRRLFAERGWQKIVGFHTRNVIHKGHEFIQLEALRRTHADGLFVHPVIGKKKKGDFHTEPIVKSYEMMIKHFYPKDTAVFGTYATFSRYAGPREALFTALCRKNFGCSHFVVGRDHTGVGDFYHPKASHRIFEKFSDLGIEPVIFDEVFYSKREGGHVHEGDDKNSHKEEEKLHISGTQARKMLMGGKKLPKWFMRPEISKAMLDLQKQGKKIFID